MSRWMTLLLVGMCCGPWLGAPATGHAQSLPGSITLPAATTVATDGDFIAWTVPAAENGATSAVHAGALRDSPAAAAVIAPGNPEPHKVLLGRLAVETVESFGWR